MSEYSAYVGLDVHKETIAVAVAWPGREEPVYRGVISSRRTSLRRLIGKLSPDGEAVSFCHEAGPCGYGVHREIDASGHHCDVVAPSLIPRAAGDRVKTDRRDAMKLARPHRSGDLTPVWVPGREQEAMRDLTRAREDIKAIELKARQRLGPFLLRHERICDRTVPVDAGALSLAGDAEVRDAAAAAGVPGICRDGAGGATPGGCHGKRDPVGRRHLVAASGG